MPPSHPDPDDLVDLAELPLLTDMYQLTMLQTYYEHGLEDQTVFELFFRKLPERRSFLVCAGLGTVLRYLETLRFTPAALGLLEGTGRFKSAFLRRLADWRFTGEVWAVPEGLPIFPACPVLQVIAPLPEAQLVETLLINQVHFQTLIASKAARVVHAAGGKPVVDFGLRRAHGLDAGMKAARAAFIGGVQSTSNLLAGLRYGVPVSGTMAHSAIEAIGDDLSAFRVFAETDPHTTCLVDTFDTLAGVDAVIRLAHELGERFQVRAVRLDSGDLAALAAAARERLDRAGLRQVGIFASGGLDEDEIERLQAAGAPIDGFGVGTSLDTSADAPAADFAYKLVEYAGQGRLKLSTGKHLLPGRKQVFRSYNGEGRALSDHLAAFAEPGEGTPLLRCVMQKGRTLPGARPPLAEVQARCRSHLDELWPDLRTLRSGAAYPVTISPLLVQRRDELEERIAAHLASMQGTR